jgi:phosphatidylglycerophosphate synthase
VDGPIALPIGVTVASVIAVVALRLAPSPLARRLAEIPNLLSLVRIPLGVLVWYAPHDRWFLAALLAVAGLTDMLDGFVARRMARHRGDDIANTGNMGAWLDPLCDKLFVLAVVVAIVITHRPHPLIIAGVMLRDVLQSLLLLAFALRYGRAQARKLDYRAVPAGKATTVLQFAAVLSIAFWPVATAPLAVLCAIAGALAIVLLARRALASVGD